MTVPRIFLNSITFELYFNKLFDIKDDASFKRDSQKNQLMCFLNHCKYYIPLYFGVNHPVWFDPSCVAEPSCAA